MEEKVRSINKRLESMPIISGTALFWLLLSVLLVIGKISIWLYVAVTTAWMMGVFFGVKYVILSLMRHDS